MKFLSQMADKALALLVPSITASQTVAAPTPPGQSVRLGLRSPARRAFAGLIRAECSGQSRTG